jgi:hypothetical protein
MEGIRNAGAGGVGRQDWQSENQDCSSQRHEDTQSLCRRCVSQGLRAVSPGLGGQTEE